VLALPRAGPGKRDRCGGRSGVKSIQDLDVVAIRQALADKVEPYALPRRMVTVDKIPMSAAGKYDRHFRNKAIGHLDHTLLERAVQWTPILFSEDHKDDLEFQTIEGHRTVIEASINSFLDDEGVQKVFKTEIDLMYPPDHDLFYQYLWKVVTESIDWVSHALSILSSNIKFHNPDESREISSIAGRTEFNLRTESDLTFNEAETKIAFDKAIAKMKEIGIQPKIIDFLEQMKAQIFI
jgi:hypothetical protein